MTNFVVTNLNDSGAGSLRAAVTLANANVDADVITFAVAGTVTLTSGELALTNDVTIDGDINGDNRAEVIISGNNASRIFNQSGAGTDVHVLSLQLSDGNAAGGNGGAMQAISGTLDIRDTTFSQNGGAHNGGGLVVMGTTTTILTSLFELNTAQNGGGIYANGGSTNISNTTVSGNAVTYNGGGIYIDGNATVTNCTIILNAADSDGNSIGSGGGIHKFGQNGETLNIANTVVALNHVGVGNVLNDVNSGVSTQIQSVNSAFSTAANVSSSGFDLFNLTQVDLGITAGTNDHSGTVDTHFVPYNTVLTDAGNNAAASGSLTDTRGEVRIAGNRVDIGVYESQLVVTNTNDSGAGSLRAAVAEANSDAAHNTITFAISLAGQTITLASELVLSTDITLDGDINNDNKADIMLSGGNTTRIFTINGAATDVDVLSLTLDHGNSGNGTGGAISKTQGNLLIMNSTISNSTSLDRGGGLYSRDGTTTIENSLFIGNSAGDGGGLYINGLNNFLINSTVIDNSSLNKGGGVYIDGNLSVISSTITGNRADSDGNALGSGGGIFKFSDAADTLTILSSVIAGNLQGSGTTLNDLRTVLPVAQTQVFSSAFGTNVAAAITDHGGNLFSQSAGQLQLGELLDNGGATLTRSMLDGSVLIDASNSAFLLLDVIDLDGDGNVSELTPLDGRNGPRQTGILDIGAVEQIVNEVIRGTAGNNFIVGGLGTDELYGMGGNDIISGGAGDDSIDGGTGSNIADYRTSTGTNVSVNLLLDTASGGHAQGDTLDNIQSLFGSLLQRDILIGDDDGNNLFGFGGIDSLVGNGGDDFIEGGAGGDTVNGGAGIDTASYANSTGTNVSVNLLTNTYSGGEAAGDLLFFIENLEGSSLQRDILIGNDIVNRIFGSGGNDSIRGEGGNDFIDGGAGADSLNGGAGIDTVHYKRSDAGVTINLSVAAQVSGGTANGDTLAFFENVNGSVFTDVITGNYQSNTIDGGAGADTLNGGLGSDYLTGGADADAFRFTDLTFGSDTITDWQDGLDHISIAPILETSFAGLTFTGNGTTDVIVKGFNGSGSAIIVHANAAFTLDASDFVFV